MSGVVRLFRLDSVAWARVSQLGTMASAAATAVGAFAFFAFDRFGFQAFIAPRATARILLVGFYGWIGLSLAAWLIARRVFASVPPLSEVVRIYGYAHLPLLILAFVVQLIAVVVQVLGPSQFVAALVFVAWMPASLVAATRYLFGASLRDALLIVGVPYLVWAGLIGLYLGRQVGHLL